MKSDFDERGKRRAERRARQMEERKRRIRLIRIGAIAGGALLMLLLFVVIGGSVRKRAEKKAEEEAAAQAAAQAEAEAEAQAAEAESAEAETAPANGIYEAGGVKHFPKETEEIDFHPAPTEDTEPTNLMNYSEICQNGEVLEDKSLYEPWYTMDFGRGDEYTEVEGVIGFRGNNFRDAPVYGISDLSEYKMTKEWSRETGSITYNDHTWSGNGWTGQPLMVRWPRDVKQHMNMTEAAKEDDNLVEVIYASMDGYIYFMDLRTGERTRDPMNLGWTFKGAGALDPRGYPIMYLGAGINSENGVARVFIINLLTCEVMYTFGNEDDFSLRGSLSFFDSSALVDAETDTLIYPGENGILYLLHLNTSYDKEAGTLSIDPDNSAKWHYWGHRSSDENYWVGMETSAAVYKGYLFVADNGGHLMCVDLNTLRFVWVQDVLDDTNGSPVLSVEDGKLYIYIAPSFHLGWRSDGTADVPIFKVNAENGEIVWQKSYECYSEEGVSGGVQSTVALGKHGLDDRIFVTVSRTGSDYDGVCACLSKADGSVLWEHRSAYAWSSPVCVYNSDGSGSVIYPDAGGKVYLLDGQTGEERDVADLGEQTVEASPAVYGNWMVFGTRDCEICGFRLS